MAIDVIEHDAPRLTVGLRSGVEWRWPAWSRRPRPVLERLFELALLAVLLGYMLFDKGFAWLHVPGTPLFVGECALALGLLMAATSRLRIETVARSSTPLIMVACFVLWCTVRALPGVQRDGIDAVRDLAVAYYGIYAWLVGMLLVRHHARIARWFDLYGRAVPALAVWLAPAIVLDQVLGERGPTVPDSAVSVFSHKISSAATHAMMALLFLWLLDRHSSRSGSRRAALTAVIVGALGIAVLLNRGSFVAVGVGVGLVWLMDRRQVGPLVARIAAIGVVALIVAYTFDLRVPAFASGRELSAQQFVDNVVSVVDPSSAEQNLSGTADWRLQYWERLVADVTRQQPVVGLGFGPNLRERFGEQDEEVPARDAHNSHIGIYARSGLVGLGLWIAVWWTWFTHVMRVRRSARRFGDVRGANIAGWLVAANVTMLVNAFFDPALEGPQVAIWTWTLFGIGAVLRPVTAPGQLVLRRPSLTTARIAT